jgi:hypothetical protein
MGPVRRRLWYLLAWAVATSVTVGVSWLGIRSVLAVAAPNHVAPLSAADMREVAPPSPSPSPTPSPVATVLPSPAAIVSPVTKPSPTPIETWAPFPDGKGGTAYRRTFRSIGGDVTIVSARGDVKIESSKPKQGYKVNVNRESGESVMVTFASARKASRVWAKWTNGPYAEVTEVTGFGL